MQSSRREIFEEDDSNSIWVEGHPEFSDSNILLTDSTIDGEKTALITPGSITQSKAKLFVEAPPERLATPAAARYEKVRKTFQAVGYGLAIVLLGFSALSFSGVVKARIVLTGSMAPVIHPGDIILTTPVQHKFPKKGDIVAYTAKRFNGATVAIISHRIIGGNVNDGFIVKGDENKLPDVQRPKLEDIKGVVIFIIPFLGNLLTPKALFLIVPCIFGFWLILDAMKNVE